MGMVAIVSGAIANKPRSGGEAWVRMSWARGLARLGWDVHFLETLSPRSCVDSAGQHTDATASVNLAHFRSCVAQGGFADRATLLLQQDDGQRTSLYGLPVDRLPDLFRSATLLVNISGHLPIDDAVLRIPHRAYVDIDPGYTQFWHAEPSCGFKLDRHSAWFTIGRAIGTATCPIPTSGLPWQPIVQPVVLDDWPVVPAPESMCFTTVATWRGAFGAVVAGGKSYGLKVHEWRKVLPLPAMAKAAEEAIQFEAALDIHPGDGRDIQSLRDNGWILADPVPASKDLHAFRQYVQQSAAEFSVAQGIYVDTRCGWFSDRTIRYLASGRPVLVQETGFSDYLQSGQGIVPFANLEQACAGAVNIARNYDAHAREARKIAERHFDSDHVLPGFLKAMGLGVTA